MLIRSVNFFSNVLDERLTTIDSSSKKQISHGHLPFVPLSR